jgi:hypothetical protein
VPRPFHLGLKNALVGSSSKFCLGYVCDNFLSAQKKKKKEKSILSSQTCVASKSNFVSVYLISILILFFVQNLSTQSHSFFFATAAQPAARLCLKGR